MTDRLLRRASELDDAHATTLAVPGKRTLTQSLSGRPQIVFRVESAEAASVFADAFGPRDRNGVAEGADVAVDRAAGSSGSPLPEELRGRFESSLGADLSAVRIHTGGDSAEASRAVGAKAYTTGQDIHFGAGQYDPSSAFGVHLLAHEVAHTVQQQGTAPIRQNKLEVSTPQDGAEVEADRAADAMVSGAPASVSSSAVRVNRVEIEGPDGEEIDMNDPHTDPDKQWKKEYKAWNEGDQNSMVSELKPIDYVAASGSSPIPDGPLPAAGIHVENMPASRSIQADRNPFFDQRLQEKFGNEPLLVKREPSPALVESWGAYSQTCNTVEALWGQCMGPLNAYLVSDKETAHDLQDALDIEIRSAAKKSVDQQVDEAGKGGAGFKVNADEKKHLAATGKSPAVKAQVDVVAASRGRLESALGGMRESMGMFKKATVAQEIDSVSTQLATLAAAKDTDEAALKKAQGLSSEAKGLIVGIISVATAAAEAWAGKPDKLVGMVADFVFEKALNSLAASEIEAAAAKLAKTNKSLDGLKSKLPGLTASLAMADIEIALGSLQKSRGMLKAELIEYRKAHEKLADVVEKHYAGQSSKPKPGLFEEQPQSKSEQEAPPEDKKMAAAIRAIPRVNKVLALADACKGPLSAGIPNSGPAQQGYVS